MATSSHENTLSGISFNFNIDEYHIFESSNKAETNYESLTMFCIISYVNIAVTELKHFACGM